MLKRHLSLFDGSGRHTGMLSNGKGSPILDRDRRPDCAIAQGIFTCYDTGVENNPKTGGGRTKQSRTLGRVAFVLSPLAAMLLYSMFVDDESMGAMIVGVLFTFLFAVIALIAFFVKGRRN
jgi:hypothetical protein